MQPRMTYKSMPPEIYQAMLHLEKTVQSFNLNSDTLHLIKIRASQINGCAYCLDMHFKEAIKSKMDMQKLYALSAWRETGFYTESERAVLAWTESLTLISNEQAPDHTYEPMRSTFDESEVAQYTLAIIAINSWNRLVLAIRSQPGSYRAA